MSARARSSKAKIWQFFLHNHSEMASENKSPLLLISLHIIDYLSNQKTDLCQNSVMYINLSLTQQPQNLAYFDIILSEFTSRRVCFQLKSHKLYYYLISYVLNYPLFLRMYSAVYTVKLYKHHHFLTVPLVYIVFTLYKRSELL